MQVIFQFCPEFLETEDPPTEYLVNELIPSGVMVLLHLEPRTFKSSAALELAIACATGTPAFGLERFSVAKPCRVLYLSQEDDVTHIRRRVRQILKARGLPPPGELAFAIHKGVNLDDPASQKTVLCQVKAGEFDLVIFDPIRRFTANADKGTC